MRAVLSNSWHTDGMDDASATRTARQRAREELTGAILDSARSQLAEVGAAQLSLRAVARDLGMASSAVYRYVASRDQLLTLLIIDSYNSIGVAAEEADRATADADAEHGGATDSAGRWSTVCRAIRSWALEHPNEWALVYGSPVTGYAAPQDTIEPAGRATRVLGQIAREALEAGQLAPPHDPLAGPMPVEPGVVELICGAGDDLHPDLAMRALTAWTVLLGAINLELFGHLNNVVTDRDQWFEGTVRLASDMIGLPRPQ